MNWLNIIKELDKKYTKLGEENNFTWFDKVDIIEQDLKKHNIEIIDINEEHDYNWDSLDFNIICKYDDKFYSFGYNELYWYYWCKEVVPVTKIVYEEKNNRFN